VDVPTVVFGGVERHRTADEGEPQMTAPDWLDLIIADQAPLLTKNPGVMVEVKDSAGSIPIMRFNQLHPPFDNPAIRRAVLGAIDQADVMNAVAGTDHT
jgi:peptide/nickel transport system substrate-binding protein